MNPIEPVAGSILIVDDDALLCRSLSRSLYQQGFSSTAVEYEETAEAAIALLARRTFTVILLDLMLPGGSGLNVVYHIEKRRQSIPSKVIVVTGSGAAVLSKVDPRVVHAIIFKPVDLAEVAGYVAILCRRLAEKSAGGA